MNTLKRLVRLLIIFTLCALFIACPQPTSDVGGLRDEFEVDILAPRGGEATSRDAFTINTHPDVAKVYAKVFNSSKVHLPAVDADSDISGVTKLNYDSIGGKWSATVKLAAPASGTITFMIWAVNSSGEHLYSGDGNLTVGSGTSITVTTGAGYSLRDMGPAGGLIFYDQGEYINGWRYLEAAPDVWSGSSYDPRYIFGHYMPDGSTNTTMGTTSEVGTGEANTEALVSAMGSTAYKYTYGSETTASYAAKICADYIGGGCEDWFLPSRGELNQMYQNLKIFGLGGFDAYEFYWSSSEDFTDPDNAYRYAWARDMTEGNEYVGTYRQNSIRVRPVRAF